MIKLTIAILLLCISPLFSQDTPTPTPANPLPDIATLMKEVEANQRESERKRMDYIYKSEQSFESLDRKGETKKHRTYQSEVFWVNGVEVERRLAVDGQPLSEDETRKQNERIDKRIEKARARREKAVAEGKPTEDGGGDFIMPIARYMELGVFTHERREVLNGRPTIVADYAGDPNAKSKKPFDDIAKFIAGTIYVDEQDKVIQHFDGHFVKGYKMGGGLLVNIGEGLSFTIRNRMVNNEAWLQESIDGNGHLRAFLFFAADGNFHLRNSDYRKFKATATVLPTFTPVPEEKN